MPKLDEYLRKMLEMKGSDLHMSTGLPPIVRRHGTMVPLRPNALTPDELADIFAEVLTPEQWAAMPEKKDFDRAYELPGEARFRCNIFYQQRGVAGVFRLIPAKVLSLEDLSCPPPVKMLAEINRGLVLVTGPTGSGKSTTLAAMIDHINRTRRCHILTIEDPVEFVHENKLALITQREVGVHTKSFSSALRVAGREDPDVILVGEMRDLETISLAIAAASFGLLVYGTLHTNSAMKTIDRIIDAFPPDDRNQVRTMLSDSLMGVVAQQLLKTADGQGRIAAHEILIGSPALSNIVREGKTNMIMNLIQAGAGIGMQTMDTCLMKLVREKKITPEAAMEKAEEKEHFRAMIKGGGAAAAAHGGHGGGH